MPKVDGFFKKKHGLTESCEYRSWRAMKERCLNPRRQNYKYYGGRGVTVCPEWINSFETFYGDMGPRKKGTSLDRINNNLGYCKENCRWATDIEQANNRRPFGTQTSKSTRPKKAREEIITILKKRGQWSA